MTWLERTEKHYTLYRSDYHVVAREKLVYLDAFFDLPQAPFNGKTVKVLLGQKFSEEDDQISIRFISTYAKALAIDLYLPHPKETFTIPNVTYLETDLIFEDVLAQLFQEYEFVHVYHFTSSVSLHLQDLPPCDHHRHFPPLLWGPSKRIATLRLSIWKGFTWLVA